MNKLAFLPFILSTPLFLLAQSESDDKEPNKCYRKYEVAEKSTKYIPFDVELCIYTGGGDLDKLNPNFVEEMSLEIIPQHKSWVKKIASDPNKLVWCEKENSAIQRNYIIVKDTTAIKEYKLVKLKTFEIENATYTEIWKEILCEKRITIDFKEKLLGTLAQKGIVVEDISTEELMKGVKIFQIENHLPIDEYNDNKDIIINLDTLEALGLN